MKPDRTQVKRETLNLTAGEFIFCFLRDAKNAAKSYAKDKDKVMKIYLLAALALLTGCCGRSGNVPETRQAVTVLQENQPCITYAASPGDILLSAEFIRESGKGDNFYKSLISSRPVITKGECLPVFGFHFEPAEQYNAYYLISNLNHPRKLILKSVFTLPGDHSGPAGVGP